MNDFTWRLLEMRMRTNNVFIRKIYSAFITIILNAKGSYIGSGANFKGKPGFPHGFYGIFISSKAVIGKGSIIFQQVTIGSNTLENSLGKGAPTIGDNCYIGAGAKIIGNVKIGNNVRVGANAVVVKDVPDNAVVVNQPTRIIVKDEKNINTFKSVNESYCAITENN